MEFKNTKFLLLFSFLRRFVKTREYLLFRDCVYQKSESIEKKQDVSFSQHWAVVEYLYHPQFSRSELQNVM